MNVTVATGVERIDKNRGKKYMTTKTLKSLMAVLAVLLSLSVYAHDVEVDGIYYNLN